MPKTFEELRQGFNKNRRSEEVEIEDVGPLTIVEMPASFAVSLMSRIDSVFGEPGDDGKRQITDVQGALDLAIDAAMASVVDGEGNRAGDAEREWFKQFTNDQLLTLQNAIFKFNGVVEDDSGNDQASTE